MPIYVKNKNKLYNFFLVTPNNTLENQSKRLAALKKKTDEVFDYLGRVNLIRRLRGVVASYFYEKQTGSEQITFAP